MRQSTKIAAAVILFVSAASSTLEAQRASSTWSPPPTARALTGALLGGGAGAFVGGIAGLYIGGNRCYSPGVSDTCQGLEGLAIGSAVGFGLGAPVGAHMLNNRRGALLPSMLTSAAIAGTGIVVFRAIDRSASGSVRTAALDAVLVSVPVLQVISLTLIEIRTSK